MRRGLELWTRDQFAPQSIFLDDAVIDQQFRIAFNQAFEPLMSVEESYDARVDQQQSRRADQPAREAVVVANDGVLHGIGQREQHDEIEWVELCELALAGDP